MHGAAFFAWGCQVARSVLWLWKSMWQKIAVPANRPYLAHDLHE
jgi:hypothetical protein